MSEKEKLVEEWDIQGTTLILCDNADDHGEGPYVDGPLARSEFDFPDGPLLRFNAYRKAWYKCLSRVKEILHTLQSPVAHAVIDSVQAAYTDSVDNVVLPSSELVSLIVSSSDRTNLHDFLGRISSSLCQQEDSVSQGGTGNDQIPGAFISRLSEFDCTNVAATMRALIAGFISQPLDDTTATKLKPSSALVSYDINVLKAWYQAVKEKYGSDIPSLVVLIYDIHTLDPGILRDLLEICSLHVPQLPLVFILGTPDPELLQSVLPRSTVACLRIDKFMLPWNVEALRHLIRETFFSPKFIPDILLGPAGFETIFEDFKRHNATLDAVLSTLQLLHIQHFYNPLSFVVDPTSERMLHSVENSPPEDWMPCFKLLRQYCIPTFQGTQDDTSPRKWSEITPHDVVRTVFNASRSFRARAKRMKLALSVLETVLTFFRSHGKKTPAIYFEQIGLEALRGSLGHNGARGIPHIMKQLSSNEAEALLEELYRLLHNVPRDTRSDAAELKQKVVIVRIKITDETIADFVDFLETYFIKTLVSFDDIPFLDIWWTGEMNIPHSPLNPNPHVSIVTALLGPQEYLGWTTPERRELSSLPDACILFRRYVESGKMINVYDWYDSFSIAVEGDASECDDNYTMDVDESPNKGRGRRKAKAALKRKRSENREEEEFGEARRREVQARFMRSIHEMEFVGFLKHTGRKADHVVKTAFDVLD